MCLLGGGGGRAGVLGEGILCANYILSPRRQQLTFLFLIFQFNKDLFLSYLSTFYTCIFILSNLKVCLLLLGVNCLPSFKIS